MKVKIELLNPSDELLILTFSELRNKYSGRLLLFDRQPTGSDIITIEFKSKLQAEAFKAELLADVYLRSGIKIR